MSDCSSLEDTNNLLINGKSMEMTKSPVSSLSLETGESSDSFQQEFLNLKQQILQLGKDKKSLMVRLKGMETLSKLLQESKKERTAQESKIRYLEAAISKLQNRLIQLGASTSLSLEEDEIFIPPISKDFSDNLLKEICRLKEELELAKTDPLEIYKLKQEMDPLRNDNQKLKSENQKLLHEKAALESSIGSTGDQKDEIIQGLRRQLQATNSLSTEGDSVCISLSEEAESLRAKLKVTGKQCQELAKRLQEKEKITKDTLVHMSDAEKDQLKLEIQSLKSQLKELVQMNTRWQQYNDQREKHVHILTEEIAQLKIQKVEHSTNPAFTEEQQRQIDRLLLQAKQRVEQEREEKERVQGDLHAADMTIKQLEEENRRLSALLETEGSARQRPEDRELIEFLQCQIQSCTEDFELERRDREAAQTKISDLESELQYVKDQLAYLQRQQNGNPYWQRREEALQMYRDGHNATHNTQGLVSRGRDEADVLLARDIVIDGGNDNNQSDDDYGFDEIDGAGSVPHVKDIKVEDEPMQCPRCKREYSSNKVDEFMEHVDICCD